MTDTLPRQRIARAADIDQMSAVMRSSILDLFPAYYNEQQTASSAIHVAHVDDALVADGTYFVHEIDGEIVACGGWSRRGRLYMGSGEHDGDDRLLDPATEAAHVRAMFVRPDWTLPWARSRHPRVEPAGREGRGVHEARSDGDPAGRSPLPSIQLPRHRVARRHDARWSDARLRGDAPAGRPLTPALSDSVVDHRLVEAVGVVLPEEACDELAPAGDAHLLEHRLDVVAHGVRRQK